MDTTEAEPAAATAETPAAPETTAAETPAVVSEEAAKPEGEAAAETTAWLFDNWNAFNICVYLT